MWYVMCRHGIIGPFTTEQLINGDCPDPMDQENLGHNRIVARTSVGDRNVSTVFLGLDHSFGYDQPVLFETMIFCNNGQDKLLDWQDRYCTMNDAVLGHLAAVQLCKDTPSSQYLFPKEPNDAEDQLPGPAENGRSR